MGAELMSADVNAMSVLGRELLLVETGGGEIHAAAVSAEEDRRAAANVDRTDPSEPPEVILGYDQAALHHERWSPKALCGRRWVEMAAGEGGAFRRFQEVELAPTCRSCLRVVDTWFPQSDAPVGLELLASMAADKVDTFGSSRVMGVPAEHVEALRRAIRKVLRGRGFRSQTHHLDGVVYLMSDDAWAAIGPDIAAQRDRDAAEAVGQIIAGNPPPEFSTGLPPDAVRWSTWVVDS